MFRARLESVKEDAVEYWIFHESLSNVEFAGKLRAAVSDLTKDYLWHKDSFDVCLPTTASNEYPAHLYSVTYFGDNIEDEWFVVYILRELTKQFEGTVVQVRDNDGEFLLIEAADVLPAWVSPETAQNRVFIFNGDVHIIPPGLINIHSTISIKNALECLRANPQITKASENVQITLNERINGYPHRITANLHRACVSLPAKYAAVLTIEPKLIAQVVNAYCNHDSLEAKVCKKMQIENCVQTHVTFTKCLYAMLTHSSMLQKASWKIPPRSSDDYKKTILGIKLTCGFEILLSTATGDTFNSKQWYSFLENLKKNGYFKEYLEGSTNYVELLDAAKKYFLSNECPNINGHVGNLIKEIMATPKFDEICTNKQLNVTEDKEDSDDWLNIDPEELNNFMSQRYGKTKKFSTGDVITPQTITDELSTFFNQTSGLDGIDLDNEDDNKESDNDDGHIDFNYDQFTNCVKNILDTLESHSDDEMDSSMDGSSDEVEDDKEEAEKYEHAMDEELSASTLSQSFCCDGKTVDVTNNVFVNLMQSIKEEKGHLGPSSSLLSTVGFSKSAMQPLDSDDDEFETMH